MSLLSRECGDEGLVGAVNPAVEIGERLPPDDALEFRDNLTRLDQCGDAAFNRRDYHSKVPLAVSLSVSLRRGPPCFDWRDLDAVQLNRLYERG